MTASLKFASFGSVSSGTLRTEDLLSSFASELEWQISRNGLFLALPENRALRDHLSKILGDAQDAWQDDGETLENVEIASEMVNELQDVLSEEFAAPFSYFGNTEGDGADFGFWPSVESARENCDFVSSKHAEFPPEDFAGEWLHVNERGNCTLLIRENGKDSEIWACV